MSDDDVDALAVGGGRVLWSSWNESGDGEAAVHSAVPGVAVRRVAFDDESFGGVDRVDAELVASSLRAAYFLDVTTSGPDYELTYLHTQLTGSLTDRLRMPIAADLGYERLQDISGHVLATLATRRRTVRAYIRDFAADPAPRPIGPRLRLAPGAFSSSVHVRVSSRWLAVLREGPKWAIRVYERDTGRRAWSIRLPGPPRATPGFSPYTRTVVWDLGEDGTVAVGIGFTARDRQRIRTRRVLGWAPPGGSFRRVSSAVYLGSPFVLRDGWLTYALPSGKTHLRLFTRSPRGRPLRSSGRIPNRDDATMLASDGKQLALLRGSDRGTRACIYAATLPVAATQRYPC